MDEIIVRLMQARMYWVICKHFKNLKYERRFFGVEASIKEKAYDENAALVFVKASFQNFLISIVLAWCFWFANKFLLDEKILNSFDVVMADKYVSLLGTISAIGGVFLDLYYISLDILSPLTHPLRLNP